MDKILVFVIINLFIYKLYAQDTLVKIKEPKRVDLQYNGLDLNWVITSSDYDIIDSLQLQYLNNKIECIDNLYKEYSNTGEGEFRICYFISKVFVYEDDPIVKSKLKKLLLSTGNENWNTGFCHIYPFIMYNKIDPLTFQQRLNLYELLCLFEWTGSNLYKEYEKKYMYNLKRSIVIESGGSYFPR